VQAYADTIGTFLLRNVAEEGHVIFVDAGERDEAGFAPFSDGLGRWSCLSRQGEPPRLRAVILDSPSRPKASRGSAGSTSRVRSPFPAAS
jgi:hypothetical protein